MFCHFFIKIRLYLAARRVENISSGVIFNLLSGGFLILAKIKIHYFEQKNCMLETNNHLRFKMIETPDNTAWSFEGHELKKWTNQKGEKWKIFVTFTVFFWQLKLDHLAGWIWSVLWNSSTLLKIPGQIRSKKSAWWTLHFKERPLKGPSSLNPTANSDTPLWVFIELLGCSDTWHDLIFLHLSSLCLFLSSSVSFFALSTL